MTGEIDYRTLQIQLDDKKLIVGSKPSEYYCDDIGRFFQDLVLRGMYTRMITFR